MGEIEEILKLDNELSQRIEEAKLCSQELIKKAREEADRIVEMSKEEIVAYGKKREIELRERIGEVEREYRKKFNNRKEEIIKVFEVHKKEILEEVIKKVLGI